MHTNFRDRWYITRCDLRAQLYEGDNAEVTIPSGVEVYVFDTDTTPDGAIWLAFKGHAGLAYFAEFLGVLDAACFLKERD